MAATFIPINTGQRLGAQARNFIDGCARQRDQGTQLNAILEKLVDDPINPTDFSQVEQQFGLQAGDGKAFYAKMQALKGLAAALADICSTCG